MFFGALLKIYQTVLPFIMRTVMIYYMGVQYLGLNSLFASILQILNLAELGISQAMTYSMYQPISEHDDQKICELLKLYRTCYTGIGWIILVIGLVLLPFLPHLISGEVPADINIYILYFIQLGMTVMSYWMFAYRSSLLEAHQRNDVISKISIIVNTVQFGCQLLVLVIWRNYYLYVLMQLAVQLVYQVLIWYFSKKMYPAYHPGGQASNKDRQRIFQQVKNLATAKFGAVILNSSDSVVISAFLGLSALAIYQNYFYLITAVTGVIASILYGALAGIGNSIVTETIEKVYQDFQVFALALSWIVGICTCCFLVLFQPFMEIWVGQELMLDFSAVILFCLYFFIYEYNQLFNLYKDAAGLWYKDRYRPLITSLTNLGLNVLLVRVIGIYGVLLSTVISIVLVGMPWLLHNLFSTLFHQSPRPFLKRFALYSLTTLGACLLAFWLGNLLDGNRYICFVLKILLAVGVSNTMYYLVFHRTKEFRQLANKIRGIRRKWG